MQKRRRPRALTLTLPDAKQPYLILEGKTYILRNFSEEGIGLWVPAPPPFGLTPGTKISGDICIDNDIYPVKLEIVHNSSHVVGLKIVSISPELHAVFKELLEPATQAAQLIPHEDSGKEDATQGYRRLWYITPTAGELLVWYNDVQKMIVSLQLRWLGKWAYRRQYHSAETGFLKDVAPASQGTKVRPDDLMVVHDLPDEEILQQAAQFLCAVPPPLPGYRLWQFLEMGEQVLIPDDLFAKIKAA